MKFDGMNFRLNRKIAFRDPQPGDVYSKDIVGMDWEGRQIPDNYCVWVRLKDCPEVSRASDLKTGREYSIVSPKLCKKIIPITGHSLTNMAYGVPKVDHDRKLIVRHMYLAYDGKCYQAVFESSRAYLKVFEPEIYRALEEEESREYEEMRKERGD